MKEGLRSVFTAAGISAGCLCIWWGSNLRDRLDVGSSTLTASSSNRVLSGLVASRDNQTNVPAGDYYSQMVALLKQYYVEPIKDDDKLANGSVRGMIASLGDSESMYMDPDDFHAYINREKGTYEGIGVELALIEHGKKEPDSHGVEPPPEDAEEAVATMSRFPTVKVVGVVPGGPADKAGVKVGDVVADIDGHWVVEDSLLEKFKKARDDFNAKKITYAQIEPLQKELRDKTERALLPAKTLAKLMVGKSGSVKVTWTRDGVSRDTTIQKAVSAMPGFSNENPIVLPMTDAGASALKDAIANHPSITIDLRNDPAGSFSAMLSCLEILARSGKYGEIVNRRSEEPTVVSVKDGNPKPPKIQLLVGSSTHGPAAILALALSSHGKANLEGTLSTAEVPIQQDVELPGGAGYNLHVGEYRTADPKTESVKRGSVAYRSAQTKPTPKVLEKGAVADRQQSMLKRENGSAQVSGGLN
jgi:carboxyl-terminal processing protease